MKTKNQTYQVTPEAKAKLLQFVKDVNEGKFNHEICAHYDDGRVMYYTVQTEDRMSCAFVSCVGLIPLAVERDISILLDNPIAFNAEGDFYHVKGKGSGILRRGDITTPAHRALECLRKRLDIMRVSA